MGTIAMAATAGKVALVNSSTALSGACPLDARVLDLVGYGSTANCFRGSGPAPAPGNSTAVLRINGGCTDSQNNSTDFVAGVPNPRNTGFPAISCTTTIASPLITSEPQTSLSRLWELQDIFDFTQEYSNVRIAVRPQHSGDLNLARPLQGREERAPFRYPIALATAETGFKRR
jgi:hypothetical protein